MIHVGIDDTDTPDTPGTNQLARALVQQVADTYQCVRITRHQLLDDPRVPFTSHNGSASILLQPLVPGDREQLVGRLRQRMPDWFVPGSDPGLCVAEVVPAGVTEFALRCQPELVTQDMARSLAAACGIHLEGLGGTAGGVIGALAAVGLSAAGNDGRVVQIGTWPDDLSGGRTSARWRPGASRCGPGRRRGHPLRPGGRWQALAAKSARPANRAVRRAQSKSPRMTPFGWRSG